MTLINPSVGHFHCMSTVDSEANLQIAEIRRVKLKMRISFSRRCTLRDICPYKFTSFRRKASEQQTIFLLLTSDDH